MGQSHLNGWRALREQSWLLAVAVWLPPLLFILLVSIFRLGTPQALPVGFVNLDHSHESYEVERHLDASPALNISHSYASPAEGADALQRADVLAIIIIPEYFGRDLRRAMSPEITAFYNNQYLLSGKFINSSLIGAAADLATRSGVALKISHGQDAVEAMASAMPVRPQITSLYNSNMSYARFLVTSILPALWQIIIVISTVLALTWRLEQGAIPDSLGDRGKAVFSVLAPICLVLWLQGIVMLGLFNLWLGWLPAGNLAWLLVGLGLTVVSVQTMAVLIIALVRDRVKAMSLCAAYLAPAFAFMGITFPRGDMNFIAWLWGGLMPSTHYMQLQVAVADHGASLSTIISPLLALLAFLLILPLAVKRLPTRLTPEVPEQVRIC